jgi:hypothetical protein
VSRLVDGVVLVAFLLIGVSFLISLGAAQSSSDFVFDTDADPVMQVPGNALINGQLNLNDNQLSNIGSVESDLTVNTERDAALSLNQEDGSWNYMEFNQSGTRHAWMGINDENDLQVHKEQGGEIALTGTNVGIGTTSPNSLLEVESGSSGPAPHLRLESTSGGENPTLLVANDNGVSTYLRTGRSGWTRGADKTILRNSGGNEILLHTSDRVSVGSGFTDIGHEFEVNGDAYHDGNVGIGTNAPTNPLTVDSGSGGPHTIVALTHQDSLTGDGATGVQIKAHNSGGNSRFGQLFVMPNDNVVGLGAGSGSSTLPINSGRSEAALFVTTDNNVGIGDSSPDAKLDVEGSMYLSQGDKTREQRLGPLQITVSADGVGGPVLKPLKRNAIMIAPRSGSTALQLNGGHIISKQGAVNGVPLLLEDARSEDASPPGIGVAIDAKNVEPGDGDIRAGDYIVYRDDSEPNRYVKWKESDGTVHNQCMTC